MAMVTSKQANELNAVDLADPRPGFLSKLDSDRVAALTEFRRFAELLFQNAPPPSFLRVPVDDRDDVISEVVLHCIDGNCARLRMFQPRKGSKFAGWLAVVANRKISDILKQQRSKNAVVSYSLSEAHEEHAPNPSPEEVAIRSELERIFLASLRKIGRRCRLLLRLKILEYKNREIVQLLRLPQEQNKKVGNHVLECRKKLVKFLRQSRFFDIERTELG